MATEARGSPRVANLYAPRRQGAYDLVMLTYLLTGLALLPMIIGEALVQAGWAGSIYESSLPGWLIRLMSGYEILLLLCTAMALFVGWILALIICVLFWRSWRMVLPAAFWLAATASLFWGVDVENKALGVFGALYAAAAFLVGLEWLIRRVMKRTDMPQPPAARQGRVS